MSKTAYTALLLAGLASPAALAAPGDYEPAYDQAGGYGTATLDERVSKLEKKLSGDSQMEMLNHVEQLQNDVLRLRGEVEELTHQLETVKKQQKDMYLDLDRRVPPAQPAAASEAPSQGNETASPEAAAPAQATPPAPVAPVPAAPAQTPPPTPAAAIPAPGSPLPNKAPDTLKPPASASPPARLPPPAASTDATARQAAYQKGFTVLKEGRYPEAIKEFKSFQATYPKGEYSDNAQYWLAEAHYVNRDLPAAREAFRKLVKEYPAAPKVADAHLKLGYIDYDTGQWASARETLGEVIKRYPDSSAAKLAQKRLDKMKQEGH